MARNYSIEIRNEKDFYFQKGVEQPDRHYAKMSSEPASKEEGTTTFRIGMSMFGRTASETLVLTPAEARDIAKSFMNAAQGAMPELPKGITELLLCFVHKKAELPTEQYLDLTRFVDDEHIKLAEDEGLVARVINPTSVPKTSGS